jgi:hypothetical protein
MGEPYWIRILVICICCGSFFHSVNVRAQPEADGLVHQLVYENDEYGFDLAYPRGLKICGHTPPNPDHGVLILLAPDALCDVPFGQYPAISAFAEGNVLLHESVDKLARNICGNDKISVMHRALGTLRSLSCTHVDGPKIKIQFFTQRVQPDTWPGHRINYHVILWTTRQRLAVDRAIAENLIFGFRLRPLS